MLRHSWLPFLLLAGLLSGACRPAATPTAEPPMLAAAAPTADLASLTVQAVPTGAQVTVDGEPRGVSPLALTLTPGEHDIAIRAAGYATFTDTITLEPGEEGIYSPELTDISPPAVTLTADPTVVPWSGQAHIRATATDNVAVTGLQLLLDDQLLAEGEDGDLMLELVPAEMAGLAPGGVYTLTARAADATGNSGQASLRLIIGDRPTPPPTPSASATAAASATASPTVTAFPSATSSPAETETATASPTPPAQPNVKPSATPAAVTQPKPTQPAPVTGFRVTKINIPTYPYTPYLQSAIDPGMAEYPLSTLDRVAYNAANSQPVPVSYTLLILENRYLRLSILPDLGGRIYECIFKPTGHNEFYRNPVIKPTTWGPPSPPYPAGANWWLAAGGLEWGFPVEEHGYEWGKKWGYDHATLPDGSVMVSLFTRDFRRPYVVVDVILPPDAAYFTVRPRITNPIAAPFKFKWWANAMLAPGPANAAGPELRFIFPAGEMTVHSSGDPTLPAAGQPFSWPIFNGRDLSRLGNWSGWLGFFERPAARGDFMGVYDTAADEGMLRIYPPETARGAKGFAMGWSEPIDWHNWTDDGSGYVELHGGLTPTFDDWYELPAGGEVSWSETWYPVAGIGGIVHATPAAAINISHTASAMRVTLFPTRPVRGKVRVAVPGLNQREWPVQIGPERPFGQEISYTDAVPAQGEVSVTLMSQAGEVVAAYQGTMPLR